MHTLLSQLFCEVSNLLDKGESNECNQGMVQVVVCTRAFLRHLSPQNLQASEAKDATSLRSELLRKLRERLARDCAAE